MIDRQPFQTRTALENLALFKTLFCSALAINITYSMTRHADFTLVRENLSHTLFLGMRWLPIPHLDHTSQILVGLLFILCLVLAVLGKYTRLVLVGASVTYFFYYGSVKDIGDVFAKTNIFPFVLATLCVAPDIEHANIAALRAVRFRRSDAPALTFRWPLTLIKGFIVITLFASAKAKLSESGLSWMEGSTFKNVLIWHHLWHDLPFGYWLAQQSVALPILCWGVFLLESSGPIALFSRRFGIIWATSAALFHIACIPTMGIYFIKNFGLVYLVFVDHNLLSDLVNLLGLNRPEKHSSNLETNQ